MPVIEFYEPIAQTIGAVVSRVRAERAVRESQKLLQTIIEGTPDAVYVKDRLGRYRLANSAAGEFVGKRPEDLIGHDDTQFFSITEATQVMEGDRTVMEAGKVLTFEELVTTADGEERTFLSTKGPLLGSDGKLAGLFGIARDITDLKKAESQRRVLEHQLFQSQKLDAIGQLAGGIAHDFNNILSAIMMELTALDVPSASRDEIDEAVSDVLLAAERASALTKKLLLFGRRQSLDLATHDLRVVVTDLSKLLRRLLGEQIELVVENANEPLWFAGDAGMIEQVVVNLCLNARDAMPGGGRLLLSTLATVPASGKEAELCLSVTDGGHGIAPDDIDRIFDPFFTTKEVGKGTGLGLSIVHGIVTQHHGRITVESEVDQGTTFRLYLPAKTAVPKRAEPQRVQALKHGNETILVVEDEFVLRHVAVRALRRNGYRVLEAADGPSAIRVWEQAGGAVDLLLTDMVMPGGISGLELCSELRRRQPGLRVVVMSGYEGSLTNDDGQATYLLKPYHLAELMGTIRTSLEATSPSQRVSETRCVSAVETSKLG